MSLLRSSGLFWIAAQEVTQLTPACAHSSSGNGSGASRTRRRPSPSLGAINPCRFCLRHQIRSEILEVVSPNRVRRKLDGLHLLGIKRRFGRRRQRVDCLPKPMKPQKELHLAPANHRPNDLHRAGTIAKQTKGQVRMALHSAESSTRTGQYTPSAISCSKRSSPMIYGFASIQLGAEIHILSGLQPRRRALRQCHSGQVIGRRKGDDGLLDRLLLRSDVSGDQGTKWRCGVPLPESGMEAGGTLLRKRFIPTVSIWSTPTTARDIRRGEITTAQTPPG